MISHASFFVSAPSGPCSSFLPLAILLFGDCAGPHRLATRTLVGVIWLVASLWAGTSVAASQSLPPPQPGSDRNIFYGAVPTGGEAAPVLVFVHGLRGTASDWWVSSTGIPNDMYDLAYTNGYRTAFVSLNPDNSRNDAPIELNAAVIASALRRSSRISAWLGFT